jgi:hypothetical protein
MSPETIGAIRTQLAVIKGHADLLTIDGHATERSRQTGRIIAQAERELEKLLRLPERNRPVEEAVAQEQLKQL